MYVPTQTTFSNKQTSRKLIEMIENYSGSGREADQIKELAKLEGVEETRLYQYWEASTIPF